MANILVERAVYAPGERVKLFLEADTGDELVVSSGGREVARAKIGAGRSEVEFEALEPGVYEAVLEREKAAASFAVLEPRDEPPLIAVVFHNHQAPNYSPDGAVREPWAYLHTWEDEFAPYYEGGAYYVQAELLSKWKLRWNANLSPSLLKQWIDLLERGAVINVDGAYKCVDPSSPAADRVRRALALFKKLSREGVLEVLTSFYSHPLAGYLAEAYGWLDLLREELRVGRRITEEVMEVEPKGAWLPEMSFSSKLVPLLTGEGVEFTVLDAVSHFIGASGDKGSIYEPYRIGDLVVFFRHTGLSDLWSFKYSNVKSAREAEAGARDLALRIVMEAYFNRARPLTIALDGENWMILPKPKPHAALLFDRLLEQLKLAEDRGLVRLVRLSEIADAAEPRKLVSVPPRSWRGGYDKWLSENAAVQKEIWTSIVEAYEAYKALENSVGCGMEEAAALMHAVNSDHIWAEFADASFSREWAGILRRKLEEVVSSIKIEGFSKGRLLLRNSLGRPVRVILKVDGRVSPLELAPGLNWVEMTGTVVRIAIKGWNREIVVGKPILRNEAKGY